MIKNVLSTYEVARLCNVHHTTVINWVNEGILPAYSTPGGHRRISKQDVVALMEKFHMPMPEGIKTRKNRILIVDDDVEAIEELQEALQDDSYKIECALNGFEAGRKIYMTHPALILLDFKMPNVDGFQVCQILKEEDKTASIPVIAITSLTSEGDVRRIRGCGVVEYFPKPVLGQPDSYLEMPKV